MIAVSQSRIRYEQAPTGRLINVGASHSVDNAVFHIECGTPDETYSPRSSAASLDREVSKDHDVRKAGIYAHTNRTRNHTDARVDPLRRLEGDCLFDPDCAVSPESRTTTSPPGTAVSTAAAKVRQGEFRVQELASFPLTADTNTRCARSDGARKTKASVRTGVGLEQRIECPSRQNRSIVRDDSDRARDVVPITPHVIVPEGLDGVAGRLAEARSVAGHR